MGRVARGINNTWHHNTIYADSTAFTSRSWNNGGRAVVLNVQIPGFINPNEHNNIGHSNRCIVKVVEGIQSTATSERAFVLHNDQAGGINLTSFNEMQDCDPRMELDSYIGYWDGASEAII